VAKKGYLYQHRMENGECIYCGRPEIPQGDTWQAIVAAKCPEHKSAKIIHSGYEHHCPVCDYSARFKVGERIWCSYCDMAELEQQWKSQGIQSIADIMNEHEDEE
jgi:hypothetical protein